MEFVQDNFDFVKIVGGNKNMENITPHKIAVVAFIREFGLLKQEAKEIIMFECTMAPKYRKDFCMLALKLIQCPDMEFKELETLITNGKYNLLSVHLQKFCSRLQSIFTNGVGALMDCITSTVDKLMIEPQETSPCMITRSSVLGFYLRRMMLNLDRLTFPQVAAVYRSFCLYYQKGRPGLMMRSLSKEKLNCVELAPCTPGSPTPPEDKSHDLSLKMVMMDRDTNFEECQWSRKQAELFTAQQASLLQINEAKALPPRQLQKIIMQIINDIPDYADAHFLSLLNCLRVKEFCGAQESLYNCFDRTISAAPVCSAAAPSACDKNKSFRYAALNRAAMHALFNHKEVAQEGLREALVLAQESGDSVCLAHVVAWMARLSGPGRRAVSWPRATRVPRAAAAAAVGAQLATMHSAVNGVNPADIFSWITRTEAINYSHSLTELTLASLANTAAVWSLYGKTEMASITCQLLLNLNTKSGGVSGAWHWTEAGEAGAAGACAVAAWRGQAALAHAIRTHHRVPAVIAVATKHAAAHALYAGKWQEAEESIQQLASIDRWESQLLKAEMFYLKGEPIHATESLNDLLDNCKTDEDTLYFMYFKLKAMILLAQIQSTYSGIHSMSCSNMTILNEVLALATKYHLHYLGATAEMHIANVQLQMGCITNALAIVKRVLPTIMAHGGAYDMARGMLLYTKCRVATAPVAGETRLQVLTSCCESLESVKKNFSKIDAQARLKETWYLQAQLYNEIGNTAARNQCAWMFRQLETQNPTEPTNMLLTSY